jgi:hypothetical protein
MLCFLISINSNAQVKTKIFDNGIPSGLLPLKTTIVNELVFKAPLELDNLLQRQNGEIERSIEYDYKFALPQAVNINFLNSSKLVEDNNYLFYSLTISAEKAINISIQFEDFNLSKSAGLSIYNKNELTDFERCYQQLK